MLEQLRLILQALPWTGPAIVGGAFLGMVSMWPFARRRSLSDRIGLALVLWCLTVALVVTLSPVKNDYFGVPTAGCDWSVWTPLDRHYWFSSGSRPPNVWLFLPAGVGVMLLDRVWRKIAGLLLLIALPPVIETVQDRYPQLKRSCSSQDVVDNWTGLALGVAVGIVLALIIGVARWVRRRTERRHAARAEVLRGREADRADLRLHGGHQGGYDEFTDFDDTPRSTVWYERADDTPPLGDDGQNTRVMPTYRDEPVSDDPDATQRIPRHDR